MSLTEKWNVFFLGKKLISVFCFTLTLPWLLLIAGLFFPEYLWGIAAVIVIGAILADPLGQGLLKRAVDRHRYRKTVLRFPGYSEKRNDLVKTKEIIRHTL